MTVRRVLTSLLMAAVLGLLIAIPLGQRRQLSIDIWLLAVSVWLAWQLSVQLIEAAPVLPAGLRGAWRWRRSADHDLDSRPRQLQALEGLVLSARDSDRAHALRLRPRLSDIAEHYLKTGHGVDRQRDGARVTAILGDVAWLVDDASGNRKPTLAEIGSLLDILLEREQHHERDHA